MQPASFVTGRVTPVPEKVVMVASLLDVPITIPPTIATP